MNKKIVKIVTDRIIESLEKGNAPWRRPWITELPQNFVTGYEYSGFNWFMLLCAPFTTPYWLTYKQVTEKGGTVKKGEQGYPIIYWNFVVGEEKSTKTGKMIKKKIPFLKYYTVFNLDQCEGIENKKERNNNKPIMEAEQIVKGYKDCPTIRIGYNGAYYRPKDDEVYVPEISKFTTSGHYHATLFHELVHSTGHEKRLNRDLVTFDTEKYSFEELIAEMGSAYLCALAKITKPDLEENTMSYVQSWLKLLNNDREMILKASTQSVKAVDYILGKSHKEVGEDA